MTDREITVSNYVSGTMFGTIELYYDNPIIMYGLSFNHMSRESGFMLDRLIIHNEKTTEGISLPELEKLEVGDYIDKYCVYNSTEDGGTASIPLRFRRVE